MLAECMHYTETFSYATTIVLTLCWHNLLKPISTCARALCQYLIYFYYYLLIVDTKMQGEASYRQALKEG